MNNKGVYSELDNHLFIRSFTQLEEEAYISVDHVVYGFTGENCTAIWPGLPVYNFVRLEGDIIVLGDRCLTIDNMELAALNILVGIWHFNNNFVDISDIETLWAQDYPNRVLKMLTRGWNYIAVFQNRIPDLEIVPTTQQRRYYYFFIFIFGKFRDDCTYLREVYSKYF